MIERNGIIDGLTKAENKRLNYHLNNPDANPKKTDQIIDAIGMIFRARAKKEKNNRKIGFRGLEAALKPRVYKFGKN